MEKHVPYSGGNRPAEGSADDRRDRQFTAHLNRFYDEVIAHFRDAESILLFGSRRGKGRARKTSRAQGLCEGIVGVDTDDKMTAPQIGQRFDGTFANSTSAPKSCSELE